MEVGWKIAQDSETSHASPESSLNFRGLSIDAQPRSAMGMPGRGSVLF